VLSFTEQIITTLVVGAIVTPAALKQKALSMRPNLGMMRHIINSAIGYNYRMSILCGIGRGQMEVLDSHVEKRRAMHDFYADLFQNYDGISVLQCLMPIILLIIG
jgi:dTDP-4-amino-4,6-dideoxygalactose transaminase